MKVVATSDTHFPFDMRLVPEGDVFVHAGDLLYEGTMHEWMLVLESLKDLTHRHKIVVPGNHDFFIAENAKAVRKQLEKEGIILLDDAVPTTVIDGVVFGGVPFVTNLPAWAYNRLDLSVEEHFDRNPELFGCDVLITHSPPHKILDSGGPGLNWGCKAYSKMYYHKGLQPTHWVVGHIHESYGMWYDTCCETKPPTSFYNVAMCDRNYEQTNEAFVFNVEN